MRKVLVAESVLFFRQLIRRTLARFADLDIRDADDAVEFGVALDEGGWDLVILDLELQGRGEGEDLLALARSKGVGTPIIVLSAHPEKNCEDGSCGVVAFFSIPFDLEGLAEQVGRALGLG